MNPSLIRSRSIAVTWLLGFAAVGIVGSVILFPSQSFEASLGGLGLWWNIIFPALLPYYILCEIITAYRLPALFGKVGIPLWRILKLPAWAGQAVASAILTGFPAGSEETARLRRSSLVGRNDAERIMMIAHFANPVLIFTIVSAVYLQRPELGVFIIVIHIGSLMISMFLFPLISMLKGRLNMEVSEHIERIQSTVKPTLGYILGNAVADSLQRLMQLGGVIIMFSVAIRLIEELGIIGLMLRFLQEVLGIMVARDVIISLFSGILEPHLGTYAFSQASVLPTVWKLSLISSALAWGGLAVHLQVRATLRGTDIRYAPFLAARITQACIACGMTLLLWKPYETHFPSDRPSFSSHSDTYNSISGLWVVPQSNMVLSIIVIVTIVVLLYFRTFRRSIKS